MKEYYEEDEELEIKASGKNSESDNDSELNDSILIDNKSEAGDNGNEEADDDEDDYDEDKIEEDIIEEDDEAKDLHARNAAALDRLYNYYLKYTFEDDKRLKSFCGDKYDMMSLKGAPTSISLGRTGGHTISMLYLLSQKDKGGNRKYSVDDLFNNKKLLKKKQETFDKVCNEALASGHSPAADDPKNEHTVWLVNTMYNGLYEGQKAIDELAEKIDYSDELFMYSEEFARMGAIANAMFDVWQEICRYPNLMNEKVRNEKAENKDFTTNQCSDYLAELYGPIGALFTDIKNTSEYHRAYLENKDYGPKGISPYTSSALKLKYYQDLFIDWKNSGVSKFSDYCKQIDAPFQAAQLETSCGQALLELCGQYSVGAYGRGIDAQIDKEISEGTLFSNVYFTGGGRDEFGNAIEFTIENVPTYSRRRGKFIKPGNGKKTLSDEALKRELDKKAAIVKDNFTTTIKANASLSEDVGKTLDYTFVSKPVIINNKEDVTKIQTALDEQLSTVDLYMMGVLYRTRNSYMTELKRDKNEPIAPEEAIDDYIEIQNEISDEVTRRLNANDNSLSGINSNVENIMLARVKSRVLAGKTYRTLFDGLDGQEQRHDKAVALMGHIGAFSMYENERLMYVKSLTNNTRLANSFARLVGFNRNMTLMEIYNKLGFTKEERNLFKSDEELQKAEKLEDIFGKNVDDDELKNRIYNQYLTVCEKRALEKILPTLSIDEQLLYQKGQNAVEEYETLKNSGLKNPEDERKLQEWENGEAKDLIEKLSSKYKKEQYSTMNAVVYGNRTIGLENRYAMRGSYREILGKNDDYMKLYIKGDPAAQNKADAAINDKKVLNNVGSVFIKLDVSYESYLKLHSGVKMGSNNEELLKNAVKCMAAVYLQEKGVKFGIKNIHKTEKYVREAFSLDAMAKHPDKLIEILKNPESAVKGFTELKRSIYGVAPKSQSKYFENMKNLYDNLSNTYGHGEQYKRLNKYIRMAFDLKTKGYKPKKLAEEIVKINMEIYDAAVDYINSKGSSIDVENNPRAISALGAIAALTSTNEGLKYRTKGVISDLQNKLSRRNSPSAKNFENLESFSKKYKASNLDLLAKQAGENVNKEAKKVPSK